MGELHLINGCCAVEQPLCDRCVVDTSGAPGPDSGGTVGASGSPHAPPAPEQVDATDGAGERLMDMLKPAIETRRRRGPALLVLLAFVSGVLVGVGGWLVGFLLAPQRVVVIERAERAFVSVPLGARTLNAKVSPRFQLIDLLSADGDRADGIPDEVFDVQLTAPLPVQHIFLNGNGGAHQWNTVIGAAAIPLGRVYGGHRRDATWHLGVRESGEWRTSETTGALRELPAGTYRLELIATGVHDGPGPRTVTVMFVDGTTITAAVETTATATHRRPATAVVDP